MKLIAFPECGKIVNTHGVMGAVKIESWCNTPAVLAKLKRVYLATPLRCWPSSSAFICRQKRA